MNKKSYVHGFACRALHGDPTPRNYSFGLYTGLNNPRMITKEEANAVYQRVCKKLEVPELYGGKIEIDLSRYAHYEQNGVPVQTPFDAECDEDPNPPLGKRKKAVYWADKDRLWIFENGELIYENCRGEICRDAAALADSYF